jgi:hypothetical protein
MPHPRLGVLTKTSPTRTINIYFANRVTVARNRIQSVANDSQKSSGSATVMATGCQLSQQELPSSREHQAVFLLIGEHTAYKQRSRRTESPRRN